MIIRDFWSNMVRVEPEMVRIQPRNLKWDGKSGVISHQIQIGWEQVDLYSNQCHTRIILPLPTTVLVTNYHTDHTLDKFDNK